jgi:serine/threonine protein kinase
MPRVGPPTRKYEYNDAKALGSGAFGEVFKGTSVNTGEEVAIKVLRKQNLAKYGDQVMELIYNEVKIL